MATLNLGRIKPVFRGAYDASTGYVVDDIVTSGNETFICILASTGNATSNATYWTKLAAKGTDGTVITQESMNWELYKSRTNCSHLKVGDKITIQGGTYILTGYNTRARKAPIQFKDVHGHTNYKCSIQLLNLENSK